MEQWKERSGGIPALGPKTLGLKFIGCVRRAIALDIHACRAGRLAGVILDSGAGTYERLNYMK